MPGRRGSGRDRGLNQRSGTPDVSSRARVTRSPPPSTSASPRRRPARWRRCSRWRSVTNDESTADVVTQRLQVHEKTAVDAAFDARLSRSLWDDRGQDGASTTDHMTASPAHRVGHGGQPSGLPGGERPAVGRWRRRCARGRPGAQVPQQPPARDGPGGGGRGLVGPVGHQCAAGGGHRRPAAWCGRPGWSVSKGPPETVPRWRSRRPTAGSAVFAMRCVGHPDRACRHRRRWRSGSTGSDCSCAVAIGHGLEQRPARRAGDGGVGPVDGADQHHHVAGLDRRRDGHRAASCCSRWCRPTVRNATLAAPGGVTVDLARGGAGRAVVVGDREGHGVGAAGGVGAVGRGAGRPWGRRRSSTRARRWCRRCRRSPAARRCSESPMQLEVKLAVGAAFCGPGVGCDDDGPHDAPAVGRVGGRGEATGRCRRRRGRCRRRRR